MASGVDPPIIHVARNRGRAVDAEIEVRAAGCLGAVGGVASPGRRRIVAELAVDAHHQRCCLRLKTIGVGKRAYVRNARHRSEVVDAAQNGAPEFSRGAAGVAGAVVAGPVRRNVIGRQVLVEIEIPRCLTILRLNPGRRDLNERQVDAEGLRAAGRRARSPILAAWRVGVSDVIAGGAPGAGRSADTGKQPSTRKKATRTSQVKFLLVSMIHPSARIGIGCCSGRPAGDRGRVSSVFIAC